MPKILFSLLLCCILQMQSSKAQTFQEYLALFEPIQQDYQLGSSDLLDSVKKKQPMAVLFHTFIDAQSNPQLEYYPYCMFRNNTTHIVLLICRDKNQPNRLSLVSRVYDSEGNPQPTQLDNKIAEGFLTYTGEDEEYNYSFFGLYDAKHHRLSIRTHQVIQTKNYNTLIAKYQAYTLNTNGFIPYSPTTDLSYDPYSNTTPYTPPTEGIKVDFSEDKIARAKVGQLVYVPVPVHGSVGVGANVTATKESILAYLDAHNAYRKPQISGETGGDGATYTFIFRAEKVGKCQVIYKKYFRGELEKTYKIKVIITN